MRMNYFVSRAAVAVRRNGAAVIAVVVSALLFGCGGADNGSDGSSAQSRARDGEAASQAHSSGHGWTTSSDLPQDQRFRVGPALRALRGDGVQSIRLFGTYIGEDYEIEASLELKRSSVQELGQYELRSDSQLSKAFTRFERRRGSVSNAVPGEPRGFSFNSMSIEFASAPTYLVRIYEFFTNDGVSLGCASSDGEVRVSVGTVVQIPEYAVCGQSGGFGSELVFPAEGGREEASSRWLLSCLDHGMAELSLIDAESELTILVGPAGEWDFREVKFDAYGVRGRFVAR